MGTVDKLMELQDKIDELLWDATYYSDSYDSGVLYTSDLYEQYIEVLKECWCTIVNNS